jgi:hypothetical protein
MVWCILLAVQRKIDENVGQVGFLFCGFCLSLFLFLFGTCFSLLVLFYNRQGVLLLIVLAWWCLHPFSRSVRVCGQEGGWGGKEEQKGEEKQQRRTPQDTGRARLGFLFESACFF